MLDELANRGWDVRIEELPRRGRLRSTVLEREISTTEVVILGKVQLRPTEQLWLRRRPTRPLIVLDVDDAIYASRPRRADAARLPSPLRYLKFLLSCRLSDFVLAGSGKLLSHARRVTPSAALVPTSVDLSRYRGPEVEAATAARTGTRLVWIGRAENLLYLEAVRPALELAVRMHPHLTLRVVCSDFPKWELPGIEAVPWSEASEATAIAEADVGLMPLRNDTWSRGKCAFKLLQYMAAGLPCVASPVGANLDAVVDGVTGFLPASLDQWVGAVDRLLASPEVRNEMGAAGRRHVLRHYDRAAVIPAACDLLEREVGRAPRQRHPDS
jgi:glycosyltransferase involved in cell wall biosynthesis